MLGDLAPFVRDRERNRETWEYEVRVGVQNEKMAFSFSFVMFLPWKKKAFASFCSKISFLFGIRGDERDHKSNVSLIQGLKWNHTLSPSAKGTLNTSAHGPRLNSQSDSLFLMALGSEALRCIWYTQWASFSSSFLFYVWSSTTQNQLDVPKSAGELKRQQMKVRGNTHLQLTSTYDGKTNKQTKKVVTLSRVSTKWLSCTYPHIDQKLFWPKPVITLFRKGADIGSIAINQAGLASGRRERFNWKGSRACEKFHAEAVSN